MKIILKEDIRGVGRKYEVKNVADGFARNFLIPRGKAEAATPQAEKDALQFLKAREKESAEAADTLRARLVSLAGKEITAFAKANEKGSLFAGIGAEEIAAVAKKQGFGEINPMNFALDEPIKSLGAHTVTLIAQGGKTGVFTLIVEEKK